MLSLLSSTLFSLFSLNLIRHGLASPCAVFDSDFNLLVLGLGGKDFSLGAQGNWTGSGSATDITTSGRPPFDGTGTTCYLAQFFNTIYVMNGDKSNPTNVGIYDAATKSWTTQSTSDAASGGASFDPSSFSAILDHDTNTFYALSAGNLFFMNFNQMTAATSTAMTWTNAGAPSFTTSSYTPVMALADNHVHFLDVPGAQAGTAQIYVIHFNFFQPDAQSYPINGSSSNFPETHGQVASFFLPTPAVQQQFAFVPDDGSQTYVIDVISNTTASLPGPSDKSASTFTAGETSLVQLTSAGSLFFLPYTAGDASTNAGAKWSQITLSGLPAAGSSPSSSGSGSGTAGATGTGTGTASGSSPSGSGKSSAETLAVNVVRTIGAGCLAALLGSLL